MRVLLNVMIVCGLVSLADYTATAQTRASTCPPVEKPTLRVSQVAALTGCPFSGVIQNTHSQTLADGTHVQTKSKTVVYRDSLGRIRAESYASTDSVPSMIQISDPVAGFSYMLLPQKSAIAYRHTFNDPAAEPKTGAQGQHASAQPFASPSAQQPRPKPTVERLESQQMEGLSVIGRRTTMTIPAGAEGNDRALTIVSESWISPDMGITLLEKTSDPRSGDSERQMTNLEQAEPDVALFQVPADYTIQNQ
jgi:hypothetical protein